MIFYEPGASAEALEEIDAFLRCADTHFGSSALTLAAKELRGTILAQQGRHEDAIDAHREVFEQRRQVLGDSHPSLMDSKVNLGVVLAGAGRPAEAEPWLRQGLAAWTATRGEDNPELVLHRVNFVDVLLQLGKTGEAREQLLSIAPSVHRALGASHPGVQQARELAAQLDVELPGATQ